MGELFYAGDFKTHFKKVCKQLFVFALKLVFFLSDKGYMNFLGGRTVGLIRTTTTT